MLNSTWKQSLYRGCFSFERIAGAFRRSRRSFLSLLCLTYLSLVSIVLDS